MFFKAINNSSDPNVLVSILLVLDAYLRMTKQDAAFLSIIQRVIVMKKAIDEIQKCTASQQVNNALNIQNGPFIASVHDLPINSPVLLYREQNADQLGKGTYHFISI